jgi:hypothetical protein
MIGRLRIRNDARELVVTSEGRLPYCLGKAVPQPLVQPTGDVRNAAPGRVAGYQDYRVYHPGPILVAFDLPLGRKVGIVSLTNPSSGIWDIRAYCGAAPDSFGFDTQYALDVWAFALPGATPSPHGLILRDPNSGVIAADFGQHSPLFPRGSGVTGGNVTRVSIPALQRPVGIGMPSFWSISESESSKPDLFDHEERRSFWRRTSGTELGTTSSVVQRYTMPAGDPHQDGIDGESTIFIIEGANLP